MEIEICHLSTVGDQVVDRVDSISLDNSGERGHLALSTRVPDHTLNEPLSRRSAGIEVNLSGRVDELHGGVPLTTSIIYAMRRSRGQFSGHSVNCLHRWE